LASEDDLGNGDILVERVLTALANFTDALSKARSLHDLCSDYLKGVRSVVPARGVGIYLSRGSGRPPRAAADGVSEYYLELYEEVGRMIDPVLKAVMETGKAVSSSELMSAEEWQSTDFYRNVLSIHGFQSTLKAPITSGGRIIGTLNFGDRETGAFDPVTRRLASILGQIVGLTVPLVARLEEMEKEGEQLEQAFDASQDALVVCDLRTGTRRPNAAARQVLDLMNDEEAELLLEDLFATRKGKHGAHDHVLTTERGKQRLTVRPVTHSDDRKVVVARLEVHTSDIEGMEVAPYAHALLSPREREVAAAVSLGLHDQQIAESLVLSVHTVKQHLKSIYKKLGVNSRVEMTRVVLIRRDSGHQT